MNYELALKLKESGFPQPESVKIPDYLPTNIINTSSVWELKENVYTPTLSKLIEACGDKFDKLLRIYTGEFVAETIGKEPHIGSTPEEAVAKLWLELNNK